MKAFQLRQEFLLLFFLLLLIISALFLRTLSFALYSILEHILCKLYLKNNNKKNIIKLIKIVEFGNQKIIPL